MKSRFSHILRSLTIALVMAGFVAHLAQPFSSQAKKNAFTQWLNHNVVASGNESETKLRNSIRQLPEQSNDFWVLVQQASRLVADHKDDFRIQFSFSDPEERSASSWLIGQWNVFETHKTGTNAILPEFPKPFYKWLSANSFHSVSIPSADVHKNGSLFSATSLFIGNITSIALIPLAGGTSINAP
ncbi:MAG: hypothetical protein JJU37_01315 [Balneolaceae bacterium]|nr:hypothetical protein [Balneolaceae bacterium]